MDEILILPRKTKLRKNDACVNSDGSFNCRCVGSCSGQILRPDQCESVVCIARLKNGKEFDIFALPDELMLDENTLWHIQEVSNG